MSRNLISIMVVSEHVIIMHIDLSGVIREGFWYSGLRTVKLGSILGDDNKLWYLCALLLAGAKMFTWNLQTWEAGLGLIFGTKSNRLNARYVYIIQKWSMQNLHMELENQVTKKQRAWHKGSGPKALQGQELYCLDFSELGCLLPYLIRQI